MSFAAGLLNTKNPLLVQDEPGKVKKSCYNLPHQDFTYGKKVADDPHPINHVVNDWQYATGVDARKEVVQKDFKTTNKLSVKSGLYTAKHQSEFRKTTQIPLQQKQGTKYIPVYLPEEDFTYGEANRPSTPVKLVIGNCYALEAENTNKQLYKTRNSKSTNTKLKFANTKNHDILKEKNQRLIAFHNKDHKQDLFKMKKFDNKGPRINTNLASFGLTSLTNQN